MNSETAYQNVKAFYQISQPSEKNVFLFIESCDYLIHTENDTNCMLALAGLYGQLQQYQLELKYLEMAVQHEDTTAYQSLGYYWYEGKGGSTDYQKAFTYFSLGEQNGCMESAIKLADMYHRGEYVSKDRERYRSIIDNLYQKISLSDCTAFDPVPEIYLRKAELLVADGEFDEALYCYKSARFALSLRLKEVPFFLGMDMMEQCVLAQHKLKSFPIAEMDLFDFYYLLQKPCTATFHIKQKEYTVQSYGEEIGITIYFLGKWYYSIKDFMNQAVVKKIRLVSMGNLVKIDEVNYESDLSTE